MNVSFVRGDELSREQCLLSARLYNKIHLVFTHAKAEHLFVPRCSMQYLAVIDRDEIIFVDGQAPRNIEFAWQSFTPQARENLNDPVSYECVIYHQKAEHALHRVPGEFYTVLNLIDKRQSAAGVQAELTSLTGKMH